MSVPENNLLWVEPFRTVSEEPCLRASDIDIECLMCAVGARNSSYRLRAVEIRPTLGLRHLDSSDQFQVVKERGKTTSPEMPISTVRLQVRKEG